MDSDAVGRGDEVGLYGEAYAFGGGGPGGGDAECREGGLAGAGEIGGRGFGGAQLFDFECVASEAGRVGQDHVAYAKECQRAVFFVASELQVTAAKVAGAEQVGVGQALGLAVQLARGNDREVAVGVFALGRRAWVYGESHGAQAGDF